jgi:hypothetical protein
MNPEIILTLIGLHLKDGKDVREAILEIGEELVSEATFQGEGKATETQQRLLACLAVKARMDRDDKDMEQALELTAAGWTAEDPRDASLPPPSNIWGKTPVMSWYWRAPSKRKGCAGRLYRSTQQALNAFKKTKVTP